MRRHERANAHPPADRHPWIDEHLVDAAEARISAGGSVVFAGPAGSGAPLYVMELEARVRTEHPDLWKSVSWHPDAGALSPAGRASVLSAIRQGDAPVVFGLSSSPRTDAAAPVDAFEAALTQTWLDGAAHRIDVGRLSDAALVRIMSETESARHLPLVSRARVIAWSNGVRVIAQQLHAAAVGAGPDVVAQRTAMARPHMGSALFDAYATLLRPLSEHDQRMLGRLIDADTPDGSRAGEVVGAEMAMRLEAARVLTPPDEHGMSHIPEPLARVAATLHALDSPATANPDATAGAEHARASAGAAPSAVADIFDRALAMDFTGAADLARGVLRRPSAAPRDRYLAAVAAGLSTAYGGSWGESALLFERADVLSDVFPHDITGSDELLGLWHEAFARAFAGADLTAVCTRLTARAVAAARAGDHDDERMASALSACLHAMAGDATAAELELAAVSADESDENAAWILPMVRISVATCFALQGDAARAEELLQVTREAAAAIPLVTWFLTVADAAVAHTRGDAPAGADPTRTAGLLRTGRGGLLLELHALFHFAAAVRTGSTGPDHLRRLHDLAARIDAPVAHAVQRWTAGTRPTFGAPPGSFLLWSGGGHARMPQEASPNTSELLSEREREVALLIADGLSNRAIAERLYLSVRTVESHVYVARQKVGAATRKDLGALVAAPAVA